MRRCLQDESRYDSLFCRSDAGRPGVRDTIRQVWQKAQFVGDDVFTIRHWNPSVLH